MRTTALLLLLAPPASSLRPAQPRCSCGRRRVVSGLAALTVAPAAHANQLAGGWEAGREANLQKMYQKQQQKDALCDGRRAVDIPDLSFWDMTFDPPCYVSGYYEVIAAGVILGTLKLGQVAEERKLASTRASAPTPESDTTDDSAPRSRSDLGSLRMQLSDEEVERKLASLRGRGGAQPTPTPDADGGAEAGDALGALLGGPLGLEVGAVLAVVAALALALAVAPIVARL